MSEKTTKEILIEISDLLKDRQDVLNALAVTLHSHPLTVFNSLESAIHEANIKDVTIPEEERCIVEGSIRRGNQYSRYPYH